jgi:hypothetical protein
VRWLAVFLAVGGAAAAVTAQPARATNECRGLQVCVRVAGPWVVVPSSLGTPRTRVEFQLSCPRGYAIGGLDAELSDHAIDIGFLGRLGSPVGPGVTTSRSAVFGAVYVGASARTPSFRPHLGCIPSAGGGPGPVPYRRASAAAAAFPPGEPTVRRVRTAHLRPGSVRAVAACGAGERLISGWHAIGFYTAAAPSAALVQSVSATRTLRNGQVHVLVHGGTDLAGVRAIVQVGAVCGGGR